MDYFMKKISIKTNNIMMFFVGLILPIIIYTSFIDKITFPIYYYYFPMLLFLFFYSLYKKIKFEIKTTIFVLIHVLYLFFSSFLSQNKYISFRYSIFFTVFILIALILSKFDSWHIIFFRSIVFISSIFVFITFLSYFFNDIYKNLFFDLFSTESQIVMQGLMRRGAHVGLTNQTANNGFLISVGLALLISKIKKGNNNILVYISIVLYSLALLMTMKRSFVIAHLISITIIYLIDYKFSKRKFKKMSSLIFSIIVVVIIIMTLQLYFPAINVFASRFTIDINNINLNKLSSGRIEIYNAALDVFGDNPVLGTGVDTGSFILDARLNRSLQQVHNVYIQLLMELGLSGSLIFFGGFFVIYFKTYKVLKYYYLKDKDISYKLKVSFYIQTFWLIYCFFGNPFTTYTFLLTYFLFSSIAIYYVYKINRGVMNVKKI